MGNVCRDGEFKGMHVYTTEDAQACRDGGGTVAEDGRSGCSAESIAARDDSGDHAESLTALRRAADQYGHARAVGMLETLSRAAAPFVEETMARDDELANAMARGLSRLARVAARGVDPEHEGAVYTAEDHEALSALAGRVAAASDDARVAELVDGAIEIAAAFVDLPPGAVRDLLGPPPDFAALEPTVTEVPTTFVHAPADAMVQLTTSYNLTASVRQMMINPEGANLAFLLADQIRATAAIDAKAAALPDVAGEAPGQLRPVIGGWVRPYPSADIYYSEATGAHEVHGDIRKKYDLLNGPGWLGLPTTDESGTPDGRGSFNHFQHDAPIYWTPTTGPMLVRGAIRRTWAKQGWERGPWGYPVADEQRIPGLSPADAPNLAWSAFEHATGFSQGNGCLEALAATLTARQLADAVRTMVDQRLSPVEVEVGPFSISVSIRPGLGVADVLGVEDFSYGFWGAVPRALGVRLNGFVSIPIGSDPTFTIDLWLRFSTAWPMAFTYPAFKSVIATLARYSVRVDGIESDAIAARITSSITELFTPDSARPEIPPWSIVLGDFPTGVDQHGSGDVNALGVMLMADGALHLLVNPLPPSIGDFRQDAAQRGLDAALKRLG